jgi:hypothetical protein
VTGLFSLVKDQQIVLAVGQPGEDKSTCDDYGAGGGGGTFVTRVVVSGDTVVPLTLDVEPLLVAAGGGGAGDSDSGCADQQSAPRAGHAASYGDGNGSTPPDSSDQGGAGYFTAGGNSGAPSFLEGAQGHDDTYDGGFGGGAGGYDAGGAGGGYTGGNTFGYMGLGGYSFNAGAARSGTDGANQDSGSVVFELLP